MGEIILIKEKQVHHNYHNEKVAKWLLENHTPEQTCSPITNFCSCDTYENIHPKTGNSLGLYIIFNGEEERYYDYSDDVIAEDIIKFVPGLTEEEKEELHDIEAVRVYYCPFCLEWATDGANI
ncbi:hypothetical protein [Bacillus sp. 1P06AnD]|uniref:hypothetical protein n=1 Tax=Bacillus sp. 1P06AnD TaxID=3132208 RepID=UPI0039A025F3